MRLPQQMSPARSGQGRRHAYVRGEVGAQGVDTFEHNMLQCATGRARGSPGGPRGRTTASAAPPSAPGWPPLARAARLCLARRATARTSCLSQRGPGCRGCRGAEASAPRAASSARNMDVCWSRSAAHAYTWTRNAAWPLPNNRLQRPSAKSKPHLLAPRRCIESLRRNAHQEYPGVGLGLGRIMVVNTRRARSGGARAHVQRGLQLGRMQQPRGGRRVARARRQRVQRGRAPARVARAPHPVCKRVCAPRRRSIRAGSVCLPGHRPGQEADSYTLPRQPTQNITPWHMRVIPRLHTRH